ncbi:hypothetical protein GCM10010423_40210 [Streptomyces levis]|uniref:Uncharacterized protein n=1 Tax=Streptomyces levis TaxID=285566 RepID=A0ABN3NW59_9ACTN|nr:hypothetical protein CHR28_26340 [Streptomyces sp. XY006]
MEARHSALCAEEAEDAVKELRAENARTGMSRPASGLAPVSFARKAPCPLTDQARPSLRPARPAAAVVR